MKRLIPAVLAALAATFTGTAQTAGHDLSRVVYTLSLIQISEPTRPY